MGLFGDDEPVLQAVTLKVPMDGYGQPNTKTCWYACYAMMYAWKGLTTSSLNEKLEAIGIPRTRGLVDTEYRKVAFAVGMDGVSYTAAKSWDLETVIHRLTCWGPIFCCTTKFQGHAMVLYGVDPGLNRLALADPYSHGTDGIWTNAHSEFWPLSTWQSMIQPVRLSLQVFK